MSHLCCSEEPRTRPSIPGVASPVLRRRIASLNLLAMPSTALEPILPLCGMDTLLAQPGAHQNPRLVSGKLLSSWVCPGRHWDLLKNSCLPSWPHTMPLSFVDCSKWSRAYPLSNCDLSIWYLPIIAWIPSTKSFLYVCAKTIKRKKTSALVSLKTALLLKISHQHFPSLMS